MLNLSWTEIWGEKELYDLQVDAVTRFMQCDSQISLEATVEFAKYLNFKGIDSDTYPLFLEFIREENHHVIEGLLGKWNAFDVLSVVQPNAFIIDYCLKMLAKHRPGSLYHRTLQLVFGVLYRSYHSPREGYSLLPLSIENLNSIGKYLDKTKKQSEGINRFILDILSDLAGFSQVDREDENINKISLHAIAIRNAFFDRLTEMETVIPAELLVREESTETEIHPRETVPLEDAG